MLLRQFPALLPLALAFIYSVHCQSCDTRLTPTVGQFAWEGAVEVVFDNRTGRVCSESWDLQDAHVVCRLLGYVGALDATAITFTSSDLIWLSDLECDGSEESLCECAPFGDGTRNITAMDCGFGSYDAGVVCQTEDEPFGVRLADGAVPWEGRVEVRVNDAWGTVCSFSVSLVAASVICRELGYTRAFDVSYTSQYGPGSGPQWLDVIVCSGEETSIFDCGNSGLGQHQGCSHQYDLGVVCEGNVTNDTAPVRLLGGSNPYEGLVEVFYNGLWGSVCRDRWSLEDAHVTCRQLGFGPAISSLVRFDVSEGPIWLDEVSCTGQEAALSECPHAGWANHDCSHALDAGVRCSALTNDPFDVRLAGSASVSAGRVEVFYGGVWGTVCDSEWDIADARVVCSQLGFAGATEAVASAAYGEGGGVVWMEDVACVGNEARLADCPFPGWGTSRCEHTRDAGVICETTVHSGTVRLMNGSSTSEGRVEVFFSGAWGTVCDDSWDHRDGDVVCRQLGYLRALSVTGEASFGLGAGPVWLDNVECMGSEDNITFCTHRGWGITNCDHGDDAGVVCTDEPEVSLRLVGGASDSEGRVEILYNGTWGTVCDNAWDINDAGVVCRHLGFTGALDAPRGASFGSADDMTPIWLEEVDCSGMESNLDECPHDGFGSHSCILGHMEDASAICEVDTELHPVRLVGGASSSEGRIEVFINGEWGTVCDDFFSGYEGRIVCQQLNYTGILQVAPRGEFGVGRGPIWLDNVFCLGSEEAITQCMHNGFGTSDCDHAEDVGVVCDTRHPGEEGAIRLVRGDGQSNGRVEVFHSGEWGTVCHDDWDIDDAKVVCRQLGLPDAILAPASSAFGAGIGVIWLTNLLCDGTEQRLEDCSHDGWGNTASCGHLNDASVVCESGDFNISVGTGPQNFDVRLILGNDSHGILQVYFSGVWGTVCQDLFSDAAAGVVCRQLGFAAGEAIWLDASLSAEGVVWLDEVQCAGGEENLDHCGHAPWGQHDCFPVHMLDVGVQCFNNTPPTTIIPAGTPLTTALPTGTPAPSTPTPASSVAVTPSNPVVVEAPRSQRKDLGTVIGIALGVSLGASLIVGVAVMLTRCIFIASHKKSHRIENAPNSQPANHPQAWGVHYQATADQQQMNDEHALETGAEKPPLDSGTATIVFSNVYKHLSPRDCLPNSTPAPPDKTDMPPPQDTLTAEDFKERFEMEKRASNLTISSYGSQAPLIPPSPNSPRPASGNGARRPLLDSDRPCSDTATPLYATVSDRGLSDSTSSQAPLIHEPSGSQEQLLDRSSNTGGGKWYRGDPPAQRVQVPPHHSSVSKV